MEINEGIINFSELDRDEREIEVFLRELIESTNDPECPFIFEKTAEGAKTQYPKISVYLDQALSKPRWFSIEYSFSKKTNKCVKAKLEIVLSESDIELIDEIKREISFFEHSPKKNESIWRSIKINHKNILSSLEMLQSVLLYRFDFLYDHRLLEKCCCDQCLACSDAKKCISTDREMAMKCNYRKHMDGGKFFYGINKNI